MKTSSHAQDAAANIVYQLLSPFLSIFNGSLGAGNSQHLLEPLFKNFFGIVLWTLQG